MHVHADRRAVTTASLRELVAALTLPGYVLRQPIEDARRVVPSGKTAGTCHLRCAGDPDAPKELDVTAAEKRAGVKRRWTIEIVNGQEQRTAYPRGPAVRSSQEIEFIHGRIVQITKVYHHQDRVAADCPLFAGSRQDRPTGGQLSELGLRRPSACARQLLSGKRPDARRYLNCKPQL